MSSTTIRMPAIHLSLKKLRLALFAFALTAGTQPILAQADVIRGRISGPNAESIQNAAVIVTSTAGGLSRNATTDATGRFTITFAGGDGDYWIQVTAIGYVVRRMQLRRVADQAILVADMRLERFTATLDTLKVSTSRPRAVPDTSSADIGGAERRIDVDAMTAAQLADIALLAGNVPGVQIVAGNPGEPSGFSILGLGAEQNETSLNGMHFSGSALPRDAGFDASLALSPYDVSRGGFSGAQLALRSRPPTNFTLRAYSLALDAPRLQWTDPAGRALGQDFGNVSLGGVLTTPIHRDRAFAHIAYQAGRRSSRLNTLLDVGPSGLRAAGLAPDSVARLLSLLGTFGVPTTVVGLPASAQSDEALVYGSLDVLSPASTGDALNITFAGSWNRQTPALLNSRSFLSSSGERRSWQGTAQLRLTRLFSSIVLSETQLAVAASRNDGARYLDLPGAIVRIESDLGNGDRGVASVVFGGSPSLDRDQRTLSVLAQNHLSWFSLDNRHRLKFTTELSRESLNERRAFNSLGTFAFNSLADLQASQPTAYTRQLTAPGHDLATYRAAVSLGDAFSPTPALQLNYGLRVDANHFASAPVNNPLVEQFLGERNDRTPQRVRLSPRLGFAFAGGHPQQVIGVDGAARDPGFTVSGGIGVFQGATGANAVTAAIDNTGLPGGIQQIACIGTATPTPEWARYRANVGSIPTVCADGTGGSVFSTTTPVVTLFARDYSAPRSVRSNLRWSSLILGGRFNARADVIYSLNLEQGGIIDLNFVPIIRFALGDEAGRPVYVPQTSVVPQTGATSTNASRRSTMFSRVNEFRSDLRSEAKQLTLSLAPVAVAQSLTWSASYVYSQLRDQVYGFSSTDGNPLLTHWARSYFDGRHQVVYSVAYNVLDLFRLNWAGSLRSGTPFTPVISGDVNGDGGGNDRAFIFDPARMATPSSAAAMRELLDHSSPRVRDCLQSQVGRIAARASCEGPWSSSASLVIGLNPVRWWHSNRFDVSFQVSNPLGAADLIVNGQDHLHGWGQPAVPDNTLLYVRGFDAAARRYVYDVNPRFGSTAPAQSTVRAPVVFTGIARIDVGPTREKQALIEQLDRGRRAPGAKLSEGALRGLYASGGVFNPLSALLRSADSLELSGSQADSLTLMGRSYARRLDAIWTPIVKRLAALPNEYNENDANALYVSGRRETIDELMELAPSINQLLTAEQRRKLPGFLVAHLDVHYLATVRSGTAGLGLAYLGGISAPRANGGDGAVASGGR